VEGLSFYDLAFDFQPNAIPSKIEPTPEKHVPSPRLVHWMPHQGPSHNQIILLIFFQTSPCPNSCSLQENWLRHYSHVQIRVAPSLEMSCVSWLTGRPDSYLLGLELGICFRMPLIRYEYLHLHPQLDLQSQYIISVGA
jgi:hypothetical protein